MRISVITVCFNSIKTIERSIRSVLKQKYSDAEYILIDGGSTDGTIDIIKKYEQDITYWNSEKDYGIYDAMNKGIMRATGDIIAFLNSDDWYEDNVFVKVDNYFRQYNAMILCGEINVFKNGKWSKYVGEMESDEENIRIGMIFHQPAIFARKEIFDKIGLFDTTYRIAADYDWMLRAYDSGCSILRVDTVFTNFSSGGVSSTDLETTVMEAESIALQALERSRQYNEQEKDVWRKKICEHYNEEYYLIQAKKSILNNELMHLPDIREKLLYYLSERSYVIWGTGAIGNETYCLLTQLGMDIDFFVNSNVEKSRIFRGKNVKPPQKIVYGSKVIVASLNYEEEIISQLDDMGFKRGTDYILYSEIRKNIGSWLMERGISNGKRDVHC